MSLSAKREAPASIHRGHQRAGTPHKTKILDEFCTTCGYRRKSAFGTSWPPLRTHAPGKLMQPPFAVYARVRGCAW